MSLSLVFHTRISMDALDLVWARRYGDSALPRIPSRPRPALMVAFAFLGNTLFLMIIVSMISNTYSKIVADATAEIQFRRWPSTALGVMPYSPIARLSISRLFLFFCHRSFSSPHDGFIRSMWQQFAF